MIGLVVGTLLPSLILAWLAGFLVRHIAPRVGLVDRPGGHKTHASATPLGGGVAIWIGVVGPFALGYVVLAVLRHNQGETWLETMLQDIGLWSFIEPHRHGLAEQSGRLWAMLAGGTVLLIVGWIDDVRGLSWRLRIAAQLMVAVVMVSQGWQLSLFLDLPWLTRLLSVLWIVGLINSFNMLDNMDGLSAGVAAIASAILAIVMLTAPEATTQGPQLFVGGFLLVLVGALVGFLWHNRPPARLFMGDAGSYFVGFCLATATLSATFAGEGLPKYSILAPLCVMAIPLYDTITVVWIRLREGRSPFEADRNHLSHRLVDFGLSRSQSVLVIYAATLGCGLGALFLHRVNGTGAILILLGISLLLGLAASLELTVRRRGRERAREAGPAEKGKGDS